MEEEVLTVSEVAARFKTSGHRVRQMIHDGRLRGFRQTEPNGTWKIPLEDCRKVFMRRAEGTKRSG